MDGCKEEKTPFLILMFLSIAGFLYFFSERGNAVGRSLHAFFFPAVGSDAVAEFII